MPSEDRKTFYIEVNDADVEYFRQKLSHALEHTPALANKFRKQLELVEDAVVIYKLSHGERE